MKALLRYCFPAGAMPIAAGVFVLLSFSVAQAQDTSQPTGTSSQKPATRQVTVVTNDNIKLQAVQPGPRTAAPAAPQPVSLIVKMPIVPSEDAAAKTSEIIALQKQIKEKQKRVELLIRLFASDERRFLQSSTDVQEDPAVQTRIRAEQEELRVESTACARLQARLDALRAGAPRP